MTAEYQSIFDSASIITKKDLCALLNLNPERTNFTPSEINRAYRKRALRFHPDKQAQYDPPLSDEMCKLLMNDITLARDYLLAGENNIHGKAFKNSIPNNKEDVIETIIKGLNSLKQYTAPVQTTVNTINLLSSSFLIQIIFSTFSEGQLNLRHLNSFTQHLAKLRPYIKDIDGTTVANFLRFVREGVNDELETQLVDFLKSISTELASDMENNNKLNTLIQSIKESREELKKLLTDEFIAKIQHIIKFWSQFIATTPSWGDLSGVFFITMLFTSTSIPKFLNAFKVISETIIEHKGLGPYLLIVLPLLATTLLMFPLNIAINITQILAWQALIASIQIIASSLTVLSALFNLVFLLNPTSNKKLSVESFRLFEALFNVSIKLPLTMILDFLNATTFILTNKHYLNFLSEELNKAFSALLNLIRPKNEIDAQENKQLVVDEPQQEPRPKPQSEQINLGFFPTESVYNDNDMWLEKLLAQHVPATETPAMHN